MSCTDVQRKWNAGTRKNVGLRKAKHINFKRHRPGHTYPGPSSLPPDLTTSPQHFKNHAEFVSHSNSSVMAPLFQLQTEGLLQLSFRADVDSDKTSSSEHDTDISHTDHSLTQSCRKCLLFYESYIKLPPTQATTLMEETTVQSASQLWHDARKLRITASTAKRVPKRPTTNPKKILNEHFYPAFKGNTATKYGKENEDNIIQLLKSRGHAVERRGLVIHPEHPWLAASPDGILDSTKLLEIKCPFKSSMSLTQFLNRPNGDIRSLGDGQYVILPDGKDGYYLQVSKKKKKKKKIHTCRWQPNS